MRVPLSWLREFVDVTLSPEELADRLTTVGLVLIILLMGLAFSNDFRRLFGG